MRKAKEFGIEKLIFLSGIASIVFVILIFVFVAREGLSLFKNVGVLDFLAGKRWYPVSDPPIFGILPLILGSVMVTVGATVISVPIGIASSFYIAEVAPRWLRDPLKTGVELLAAIPSVVLGFVGMVTLVPLLREALDLPTGLTAFAGSIMLAFMAMPTIVSIAEDAITAVPNSYREGALALGATKWQSMHRVVFHAAMPGIIAAVMLGIGRVIGETMAVMMVTGNAAVIPFSLLRPVRTMTATIAAEMGEVVHGSEHYYALFAIGIVLFVITFAINLLADVSMRRLKR